MKFAKYTFWLTGVYGILLVFPMYFFEKQIGSDYPPAITHPEYYYGFIGAVLTWHLAFFLIGSDPQRYQLLMIPAALGKFVYSLEIAILFFNGRVPNLAIVFAAIDAILGILFVLAYLKTGKDEKSLNKQSPQAT
jgi:hypothetical protein